MSPPPPGNRPTGTHEISILESSLLPMGKRYNNIYKLGEKVMQNECEVESGGVGCVERRTLELKRGND